jgi:hypothetical protein
MQHRPTPHPLPTAAAQLLAERAAALDALHAAQARVDEAAAAAAARQAEAERAAREAEGAVSRAGGRVREPLATKERPTGGRSVHGKQGAMLL